MVNRWDRMKAVERMQDHIDRHLKEPITLQDLAKAARYSPYHAARVFKEHTGKSPFEYIRALRIAAAARVLAEEPVRVVDVAFDFVFDSHEGFTRAFARQLGMSPSAYRKSESRPALFMPARMRDHFARLQRGAMTMTDDNKKKKQEVVFVQIIERPGRKLILKRGKKADHYFAYCDEVGCEVFEELGKIRDALHEPMGMWLPDALRPEGYELIDLPPAKLLVFQGPPFEDDRFESAIESLWEVMSSYDPEIIGYEWADDDAPRFQLEPTGYRGYIEGRPVRAISR